MINDSTKFSIENTVTICPSDNPDEYIVSVELGDAECIVEFSVNKTAMDNNKEGIIKELIEVTNRLKEEHQH